jgi:hypothetical protein
MAKISRICSSDANPVRGRLLDQLVFANGFPDFLTLEAYRLLD